MMGTLSSSALLFSVPVYCAGVERMTSLETLDLSGNILCDHGALLPLYSLSSLKQVCDRCL